MVILYVSTKLEIFDNEGKDDGEILWLGFPIAEGMKNTPGGLRPFYKMDKAYMNWVLEMIALLKKRVENGAASQKQLDTMLARLKTIIELLKPVQ